jgi:uncharacterized protein YjbI with pentapeptide repeats
MANEQHLSIIKDGIATWNRWRSENPEVRPDLSGANLMHMNMEGANLYRANLCEAVLTHSKAANAIFASADLRGLTAVNVCFQNADFTYCSMGTQVGARTNLTGSDLRYTIFDNADLQRVDFTTADLRHAKLRFTNPVGIAVRASLERADLREADLSHAWFNSSFAENANFLGANLEYAHFSGANLEWACMRYAKLDNMDLSGASLRNAFIDHSSLRNVNLEDVDLRDAFLDHSDLTGSNLQFSRLANTKLDHANLSNCFVYGISVWDVNLKETRQDQLVTTKIDSPALTVDSLEVAQFLYLLLHNEKLRTVIDTITSKVVLILGRFSPTRKPVLNALREALRLKGYLPVMFDFDKPDNRDLTETISLLGHISRFVIADITDARSVPQELMKIVPDLPSVPVKPIIEANTEEYGMFEHFRRFPSVLPVYTYLDIADLNMCIEREIIGMSERFLDHLHDDNIELKS